MPSTVSVANVIPSSPEKRYWGPFFHGNNLICLSHLEPHDVPCVTPDGHTRRVRVIYSPHVFTRGATPQDPLTSLCFDKRVYCPDRYRESFRLPGIVASFPNVKVFQTHEKRNYLFLAVDLPAQADRYHIFFEVSKEGGKRNRHVLLRVESAYRGDPESYTPPKVPNSIRFAMLVQNVFLERPIDFAPR
ncbi:hypothetical protein SAMN05421763_11726 [[Luteovulum] sphaeroides subsp. megalophilum]|nr:hypothetical protein SAMN05421763_11726 [[Luteovulum] sphaeroides subsp. megalophilum]